MNNQMKVLLIVSLLLTSMVGVLDSYRAAAQRGTSAQIVTQTHARIVITGSDSKAPIKITSVKAKTGRVETNKEFFGHNNWLKGLTVRLTNNSRKTITFAEVLIIFWRTYDQAAGRSAGWTLSVGIDPFSPETLGQFSMHPVAPGDDIELILSDAKYAEANAFSNRLGFLTQSGRWS